VTDEVDLIIRLKDAAEYLHEISPTSAVIELLVEAVDEIEYLRDELAHSDDIIVNSTDDDGNETILCHITGEEAQQIRDMAIGEWINAALQQLIEDRKKESD